MPKHTVNRYGWPLAAALVVSALAPAFLATALMLLTDGRYEELSIFLLSAFVVALLHALVLGLPLFLVLAPKGWVTGVSCAVGGFFIGWIPAGILSSSFVIGSRLFPSSALSSIYVASVNVVSIEIVAFFFVLGGLGSVGGLGFWLVLKASGALVANAQRPEQSSVNTGRRTAISRVVSSYILVGAVGLTAGVLILETVTQDRSCHNVLRAGQPSDGPTARIALDVRKQDLPALENILRNFSAEHELSFRDLGRRRDQSFIDLSLCVEDGIKISVLTENSGIDRDRGSEFGGVLLLVYLLEANADWQSLTGGLMSTLEERWPQKVIFDGPHGSELYPAQ